MDYTKFLTDSLVDASLAFFEELGIKVLPYTSEPIQLDEFIENPRQYATKHLDDIKNIYYVGTVAESSFDGSSDKAVELKNIKERYEGLFIFAIEMKEGTHMTRSDMADLTRAYNRASLAAPVILLIKNGIFLSFCICERTEYKRLQEGEKIGKVTILRDLNLEHPHRGHLQILNSIEGGKCHSFEELYEHLMSVFSSELLTRQFYTELQNWYFWAVKNVQFPNDIEDDKDDEKYNNQNIIRLITRLIFVWFLKRKGLINPAFFDVDELKNILNSFQPNANNRYNYYRAILQNLFFATLNQKIEERRFVTKEDNMKEDKEKNSLYFGIKRYFRNFDYFKIDKSKPKEDEERRIVDLFNQSPNVNGSLFECLDNRVIDGHIYCFDGFSNSEYRKNNNDLRHPYLNEAKVPNILFFGTNVIVDLSKEYDSKKMKEVEVNGIINILKHYNFTVEENTPMEEDVALDPELLGKAFENLLGAYNPETKSTARKNTGSYYTPRPIVNYMVKESLHAYLKTKVPEVKDESIDSLLSYNEDKIPEDINPQTSKQIMTALYHCKILDPACGSGAFPMGCLQQMVHILRKLDANNSVWEDIVLDETIKEAAAIGDVPEKVKIARRNEIKKTFEDKLQNADYARKLYIIENCIYGVDIQTVAVQISRLRFFISLLCEQHTNNDPKQNYGVLPLPNLESNFVAANTLVSVDLTKEENDFLNDNDILSLKQQLRENRHKLFMPKDNKDKEKLQTEDVRLRQCIESKVEELYKTYIEAKIETEQENIKTIKKSLEELNEPEMMNQYEVIKTTDLFGVVHEEKVKKVNRKSVLLQKLHQAESEISRLQHQDKIKQVIDTVKRLTSWDMFDQNASSSFFDPEWMFDVKDGFDVVIANPPYISSKELSADDKASYKLSYKTAEKQFDMYSLFIEKGLSLTRNNEVISYIVPDSIIGRQNFEKVRNSLVIDNKILKWVHLNKVFDAAVVSSLIFVCKKEKGKAYSFEYTKAPDTNSWRSGKSNSIYVFTDVIERTPNKAVLFANKKEILLLLKILENSTFEDHCIMWRGEEIGKSCNYILSTKEDDCMPLVTGEEAYRYSNVDSHRWIKKCNVKKSIKDYSSPKILIRQVGDYINATVDEKSSVTTQSVYSLYPHEPNELKHLYALCAILNSKLFNFCYNLISGDKQMFKRIILENIKQLPFPDINNAYIESLDNQVKQIFEKNYASNDRDIDSILKEIDKEVYQIYGLSSEEISVVEQTTE